MVCRQGLGAGAGHPTEQAAGAAWLLKCHSSATSNSSMWVDSAAGADEQAAQAAKTALTTCSEFRMATLMLVLNRRLMTEQSAARRLVSCAVSVASKKATGWLMSRPNSWLLWGVQGARRGLKLALPTAA